MTRQEILSFLKTKKPLLRDKFHVVRIGLFGSFAADAATENSDIDLLVEFEGGDLNIFNIKRQLREFLRQQLGRDVDLANPKYLKPYYKEKILNAAAYA